MGFFRLLGMVSDPALLKEMGQLVLQPIIEYDEHHNAQYVETLSCYLEANGSVQAVAEQMFTHRNTVIYRINNIKKILETDLDTAPSRCMRTVPRSGLTFCSCLLFRADRWQKLIPASRFLRTAR